MKARGTVPTLFIQAQLFALVILHIACFLKQRVYTKYGFISVGVKTGYNQGRLFRLCRLAQPPAPPVRCSCARLHRLAQSAGENLVSLRVRSLVMVPCDIRKCGIGLHSAVFGHTCCGTVLMLTSKMNSGWVGLLLSWRGARLNIESEPSADFR